jgi:hypothetical protein
MSAHRLCRSAAGRLGRVRCCGLLCGERRIELISEIMRIDAAAWKCSLYAGQGPGDPAKSRLGRPGPVGDANDLAAADPGDAEPVNVGPRRAVTPEQYARHEPPGTQLDIGRTREQLHHRYRNAQEKSNSSPPGTRSSAPQPPANETKCTAAAQDEHCLPATAIEPLGSCHHASAQRLLPLSREPRARASALAVGFVAARRLLRRVGQATAPAQAGHGCGSCSRASARRLARADSQPRKRGTGVQNRRNVLQIITPASPPVELPGFWIPPCSATAIRKPSG